MADLIPSKEEMNQALILRQGEELTKKLAGASVAVCGLGGLGSNIALSLARAGIGKLILIDFDHVDVTNLHRQQYRASQTGQYKTEALSVILKEISPYTELELHTERIDENNAFSLLKDAEIICEAFDDPENKAMLTNIVLECMPEKYLVAASGMAGIDSGNRIRTRRLTEKFYLCGDGVSEVSEADCLLAPRVMLCAAHQALTVLRLLSGHPEA